MSDISNITIVGSGLYAPVSLLTNAELAERFSVDESWIIEKTGIRKRHVAEANEDSGTMGARAALSALESCGVSAQEVDMVICATSTPNWSQPATAAAIHGQVGMRGTAGSVDVNAVCSGYVYALHMGFAMLNAQPNWNYVLVVGSDTYSRVIDPNDRSTAVLFGDGAGALLLGRSKRNAGLVGAAFGTRFDLHDSLIVPAGEPFLKMDGRVVREFASSSFWPAIDAAIADSSGVESIDLVIPHQSNLRILEQAFAESGLSEDQIVLTVDEYGNTAAASIPMAYASASDRIGDDMTLCFVGYGGGLTWASLIVKT